MSSNPSELRRLVVAVPDALMPVAVPENVDLWALSALPPTGALARVDLLVLPFWPLASIRKLMDRIDQLGVVQTLTAGVDGLLTLIPAGATVCNARGLHDVPVAEWVVSALLAITHGLPQHLESQHAGRWGHPSEGELAGQVVLIVGYGSIGRALEARLTPFDVTLVRVARHAREGVFAFSALPSLLPRAEVVVLLAPLTQETEHMVNASFLAALPDGAILVNAGRGRLVDTDALLAELQRGRLRAALDVTDPEPLPRGHALFSAPGVLVTPHTASRSPRQTERARAFVEDQLDRLIAGRALRNVVWTSRGRP